MTFTVEETGDVFTFSSPVMFNTTRSQGLDMIAWCNKELGKQNTAWGLDYSHPGIQWWFRHQDDYVKFMLTWA